MNDIIIGSKPEDFVWASGVEDTFVPQTRDHHRALDEYELMGHYEHWREDLALGRDLKLKALRWGVPWYRVEPERGNFDWGWTDKVIPYLVDELGITPIIDLMHYGCPLWLDKEFAHRDYPQAVARYAAEFARRYHKLVRWYTPLNEPLINALMCGMRSIWPPYLRGDRGYIRIMLQLVRGILNTVEAIKGIDSNAVVVHVEAAGLTRAVRAELSALALEDQRRGYLSYDLLTGNVTHDHPLFTWLLRHGATPDELAEIAARRIPIDVMGLNFYPQWSTKQIYTDQKGRLAYRNVEQEGEGFAALITDYYQRFQVPVMVTETSAVGSEEVRLRWLQASLAAIKQLRGQGIPVHGYTWFPMFTMIDWRYRSGRNPLDSYYLDLGFFKINNQNNAGERWTRLPLVDEWRRYVDHPADAVGTIINSA